ncbi:MAG TPA: HAD hydrolase family protein [Candidatus Avacidaminococcus intestinavium]|uniref:HAD hydrolase family protein n=1 Tax=Candidatus Avacidaminococcus intestinavium TaxID=2840684 RepID=A0A9D1MPE7_9FIRM|nr:HAD hydrolase family protein [Candidatus Avacidaminococcus intestinavium]
MAKSEKIKLLALDVDGVLTDGGLFIGAEGESAKKFHAQDGMGITCALRNGLLIALITGRQSKIVASRAAELNVTEVYQGVKNKAQLLTTLAEKHGLTLEEVAYMGDDLNDLPALVLAGLSCAPQNAVKEVKERVHYIAAASGGNGAVREIIEVILRARGLWKQIVADYIKEGQGDSQ